MSALSQVSCDQLGVGKDGFEFPESSSGLSDTPQFRGLLPEEYCSGKNT